MSAAGPVIVSATSKHTATLIFLHGLGDTGHGWATAMAQVRSPHIKIICPTASSMPVTLNSGLHMPSWFDLKTLDAGGPEDEVGIKRAALMVHSMIQKEEKEGIPSDRVLLGGFSQGGALAIYTALTYDKQLAGIAALSCWLPLHKQFPAIHPDYQRKSRIQVEQLLKAAVSNRDTPLLQCHGDCDPIVPYKWGQMTASLLKQFLKHTEFKTYRGMMHSSNDDEMEDLKAFVEKTLPSM